MSELSAQCDRLRGGAAILDAYGYKMAAREMRDAADTIEELAQEKSENGWSRDFLDLIAAKLQLTNARSLVDYVGKLEADNAKLCALVMGMWRDIPKSESCGWDSAAGHCTGYEDCNGECGWWYRMRKLGVEVEP